jgi:lipopolysaccharide export system protein LptC
MPRDARVEAQTRAAQTDLQVGIYGKQVFVEAWAMLGSCRDDQQFSAAVQSCASCDKIVA